MKVDSDTPGSPKPLDCIPRAPDLQPEKTLVQGEAGPGKRCAPVVPVMIDASVPGVNLADDGEYMATSSYLRRMNQRRIIESVARLRRVSRAELARAAG